MLNKELKIVEKNNLKQIKRLTRKGNKILSITELIETGLLNIKLAGLFLFTILHKFSFMVAAGPNGAGKSTLMGALLAFLKPGVRILNFREIGNLPVLNDNQCIIAHEIYNRPFPGYIWGKDAASLISLAKTKMIATTIHATNIDELKTLLLNSPLNVKKEDFCNIDLIIFLRIDSNLFKIHRKIDTIYYCYKEKTELLYSSTADAQSNSHDFERYIINLGKKLKIHPWIIYKEISRCIKFIIHLQENRVYSFSDIRKNILKNFRGIF